MSEVTVYTVGFCPYCFLAKRLLDRNGIRYRERRLTRADRPSLAELPPGAGMTFPQIVAGERSIDGYAGLRRLERDGSLPAALKSF
jgi:glutaredoxin 3